MERTEKRDELDGRMQRIEQLLARIARQLEARGEARQGMIQEILLSQAAYLGDYRALTYLRSGQKIFVDTRSVDVASHLLLGGEWEPQYVAAFTRLLRPGHVVLDLGANQGVYSLLAAGRVAPNGHVYAFEPNPRFHPLLKDSIAVNGLDSVITLVGKAVADREGETALVFEDRRPAGGRLSSASSPGPTGDGTGLTCMVETIVLDREFPDLRVDVVKMDIEGAEASALNGMTALIDRSHDLRIMMEFSPLLMSTFNRNAEYAANFLASRGFCCWKINADGSLSPTRWEVLLAERDAIQNVIVSRQNLP